MLNLSPSLMCADQGYFAEEVKQLEAAGATTFHMDIMDGEFVPNFALSWAQVGYCRKISKLNLEAHLMVKFPGTFPVPQALFRKKGLFIELKHRLYLVH